MFDKPSAPEGPCELKDVTADMLFISWKQPKSDGGAPVSNYIIEKMEDGGDWIEVNLLLLKHNNRVVN